MTHALIERAMVVNLSVGIWQGYRLDREASRDVTARAGADADAARVNKHLIPKDALKPIVTAANAVRSHFYSKTMPWRDNGDRLLTRKLYTKFIEEHEALVAAFKSEVETFLADKYPAAIEKAEFRMGEMFDRDDYPPVHDLRRRFYVGMSIDAVTTANDFRVQIDQEHVDKIRAQMATEADDRLKAAMGDIWKRMADTVGYFQQRMANPEAVFRDSTVTNIAELLDLIPGLNVLDDPDIEAVRAAIAHSLGGIEAKDIRRDPDLRTALAGEASEIVDKMRGFMAAFGASAT